MRLRHIEVFHAVYTYGSITAAAKALNVSQPSVSKVLAHAEQQLGFQLFNRLKGKIVPTPEADRLIAHVEEVYENINEVRRVSENLRASDTGLIRMAMTPALGIDMVPATIAAYLNQYPKTQFELETLHQYQVVKALKESRVDIGLVFNSPAEPGIKSERLVSGEFVALTHKSMGFEKKSRLTFADLDGKPFISLNKRSPLGTLLDHRIKASGGSYNTIAKVETYQMAKSLVAHGAGVAIVDEVTARSSGHSNVVARKLDPPLSFNITLLHLESEPLSIISQRFIEQLRVAANNFLHKSES